MLIGTSLKKPILNTVHFYLADLLVDDKDNQKIDDGLNLRGIVLFVVLQNHGY